MPYLNLDPNYFDHPKTRRLVGILGPMADVFPIRLWAYCARVHPSDGSMKGYSDIEIEGIIRWSGTPKIAIQAMTAVGFIKHTKRGYFCIDWLQHEGHLEAFRRRGIEAANARWTRYATSNATSNAKKNLSNAPAVPAVPTIPITDNNRKNTPLAVDFSEIRFPYGKHKGVHISNLPVDECQLYLKDQRLGSRIRAALEARIKSKYDDMTPEQKKDLTAWGGRLCKKCAEQRTIDFPGRKRP